MSFTALVNGRSGSVTWSVNGVEGGSSLTGTISPSGQFAAPTSLSASDTLTVSATSTADSSKSASASVTVLSDAVSIGFCAPTWATQTILDSSRGNTFEFMGPVTVSGASDTSYVLSINGVENNGNLGSLTPGDGVCGGSVSGYYYYLPSQGFTTTQNLILTATSVADPTQSQNTYLTLHVISATNVTVGAIGCVSVPPGQD